MSRFRDDRYVPSIRSLEDITHLPYTVGRGTRLVITCPPVDVDAWKAGIASQDWGALEVVVIVTQGLPEGTALIWHAEKPGTPAPARVIFDRYYREESA